MSLPQIAVTMGDPAGVGPELCLRLLNEPSLRGQCAPVIFGDASLLRRVARHCAIPEPCRVWDEPRDAAGSGVVNVPVAGMDRVEPGSVDAASGRASAAFVEAAIAAVQSGQMDALVTCPVHKEALRASGVPFPGHTELLAARTGSPRACMMLTSDEISCAFVTAHVGYQDVPALLSVDRIVEVIELAAEALSRLRGRAARVVVCGLNPHAGEHGLFGAGEEERLIAPAVERARALGIEVAGPLPPDTAFIAERRRITDVFICMYHDQGSIPLKALAFDRAVNVTLGLPLVRTSVDHGTALDIAWQGRAHPGSLFAAVRLAVQLSSSPAIPQPTPCVCT